MPTRSSQAGLRFRARKLGPKQPLPVLREDEIESEEYKELLENQYKVETGVEKSEENEYHLQQALAAALGRGNSKDAQKIVPAPPAQETTAIKYDEIYALKLPISSSYIRFSETVEECTGCQYDMTTDDDTWLVAYNKQKPVSSQCSEDDFERIMEVFESTADQQAPFAAVDNTVVPFDDMELSLKRDLDSKAQLRAKDIYDYWKSKRQDSANKGLQPSLKFEVHQDSDDADPYVCFRRRDVRQTRKTRARDVQVTDKLKRLRKEMEEARQLVVMAHQRELAKRDQINLDRAIFEKRAQVKDVRIRLGIKVDDDDLITRKEAPKRKANDAPQPQRPSTTQLRVPVRPDGRQIDADLTLLSDVLAQKENMLKTITDEKLQQHQRWNTNYVDVTRDPLTYRFGPKVDSSFRLATTQYLITPPASVTSENIDDGASPPAEKDDVVAVRFAPPSEDWECARQPAYRRRTGRLGRLWIDRRGLPLSPSNELSEDRLKRFKYDQDDDDEPPVYAVDPYDTAAIKFRATIPPWARAGNQITASSTTVSPNRTATAAAPSNTAPT